MTDPPLSFNLWTEPWIRVTRCDGDDDELSIGACLVEAHTLAALGDPSPLVVAGTHRLLVAILQAIYAPQDLGTIATLLRAGRFDPARLEGFAAVYAGRFDLFHPEVPFLQTGDVPLDGWKKPEKGQKHPWADPKPVAVLFAELPVETNRTHFHHVTDEGHRLCPACCARGLVTVPAFAMSGGRGYAPSINGEPPVYVFPAGSSLFKALASSLTTPGYQPAVRDPSRSTHAPWTSDPIVPKDTPVSTIGYLESLTFPARRMRLYPQDEPATCTQCGHPTRYSVSIMLFEMGLWLSDGVGQWDDPFITLIEPRGSSKRQTAGMKPLRVQKGKALWREYSSLLLTQSQTSHRPKVVEQIAKLVDRSAVAEDHMYLFRCIGLRNPPGKANVYEWLDEALEAPPALLNDDTAVLYVEEALKRTDEVCFIIESSFDSHFRPERDRGRRDAKLARFKGVRARMSADYWTRLAPLFRAFISDMGREDEREALAQAWVVTLVREGRRSFDYATEQVGERAVALRARVEAQAACHRRLSIKRKAWSGEQQ